MTVKIFMQLYCCRPTCSPLSILNIFSRKGWATLTQEFKNCLGLTLHGMPISAKGMKRSDWMIWWSEWLILQVRPSRKWSPKINLGGRKRAEAELGRGRHEIIMQLLRSLGQPLGELQSKNCQLEGVLNWADLRIVCIQVGAVTFPSSLVKSCRMELRSYLKYSYHGMYMK